MSDLVKRFQVLLSIVSVLLVLAAGACVWFWLQMRGSLPRLDGEANAPGLSAPVAIARDALGVPTIGASSRADAARALGFLHAQERFFQMDLQRRSAAGELAALIGKAAVPMDRAVRLHRFRRLAGQSLNLLPADKRAILDAYTEGVNTGLAALGKKPWEYYVLRSDPRPWKPEDSFLVIHAMWLDLQDHRGEFELTLRALRTALGESGLEFFAPRGDSWDAALDGTTLPAPELPTIRLKRNLDTSAIGREARAESYAYASGDLLAESLELRPGSNTFALAGAHTATGAALLENDVHLNLRVPNIWYRAVMKWTDGVGEHSVAGITLPGVPALVAGSNGRISWGFTNSYVDTVDIIITETDGIAQYQYRTIAGWRDITEEYDTIEVRGDDLVKQFVQTTEWGPIMGGARDGRYTTVRWVAHDPAATDLALMDLETAPDVDAAIDIGRRAGMPNQNLFVADAAGNVAWTVTGKIPRRHGYDGRLPVSWAYGDRYWDGYLAPEEVPFIKNPADGYLWSANNRMVGGEAYAKLGDGGYDEGPRAVQIRDGLRALVSSDKKAAPADLLAIALDDRAIFLKRWQELLLGTLSDEAVAKKGSRAELRDAVRDWNGRASTDSASFRLARAFRNRVADLALDPFFQLSRQYYDRAGRSRLIIDDALWRLIEEKPIHLLNAEFPSWDALLLAAADAVASDADKAASSPEKFTWGRRNTLRMEHPFSSFLPGPLSRLLDMPADELPGDNFMPRVQSPGFGSAMRMIVSPGREAEGILHMPGGQSGHPMSPFYRAGHEAWAKGEPSPLLPGATVHTLTLRP